MIEAVKLDALKAPAPGGDVVPIDQCQPPSEQELQGLRTVISDSLKGTAAAPTTVALSQQGAHHQLLSCPLARALATPPHGSRTPEIGQPSPASSSDGAVTPRNTPALNDEHVVFQPVMPSSEDNPTMGNTEGPSSTAQQQTDSHIIDPLTTSSRTERIIAAGVSLTGRTAARGGPSTYRGVVWHKSNSKWEARIYEGGKQKFLGYFTVEDAAALAYDDYAARIHGSSAKLNFPESYNGVPLPHPSELPPPSVLARQQSSAPRPTSAQRPPKQPSATTTYQQQRSTVVIHRQPHNRRQHIPPFTTTASNNAHHRTAHNHATSKGSSRFRGVSWNSNCGKWRAQVWKGSEVHHLGYFEKEEDAARAYDEAVLRIRGPDAPTNYPPAYYSAPADEDDDTLNDNTGSDLLGVSWNDSKNAWNSEIWDGRRYKLLGTFSTEEEAARAYDVACLTQHGADAIINYSLSNYEDELAAMSLLDIAADPHGYQELWDGEEGEERKSRSALSPPPFATQSHPGNGSNNNVLDVGMNEDTTWSDHTNNNKNNNASPPTTATHSRSVTPQPSVPTQQNKTTTIAVTAPKVVVVHQPPQSSAAPAASSRYVGVSFDRRKEKWFSQVQIKGKRKFLGYFASEEDAADAYNKYQNNNRHAVETETMRALPEMETSYIRSHQLPPFIAQQAQHRSFQLPVAPLALHQHLTPATISMQQQQQQLQQQQQALAQVLHVLAARQNKAEHNAARQRMAFAALMEQYARMQQHAQGGSGAPHQPMVDAEALNGMVPRCEDSSFNAFGAPVMMAKKPRLV